MPGLSAATVLELYERAQHLAPVERAVTLAAAVAPVASPDEIAQLPLGRRDARLLALRRELTAERLEATAACPACREYMEFTADAEALPTRGAGPAAAAPVEVDSFAVHWRSPDSRDLAAAAREDAAGAERVLLRRCVTSATGPQGEVTGDALPAAVRGAVAEAMGAADPLAEVLVQLSCPTCGTGFVADLDLPGFVWAELRARAQRLLREVDALARAYGWSEGAVLALSEDRREAYLQLAAEAAS